MKIEHWRQMGGVQILSAPGDSQICSTIIAATGSDDSFLWELVFIGVTY